MRMVMRQATVRTVYRSFHDISRPKIIILNNNYNTGETGIDIDTGIIDSDTFLCRYLVQRFFLVTRGTYEQRKYSLHEKVAQGHR